MVAAVPVLTDRKGGLGEALPNEGSFCVTGLVLGDCLGAIDCLGSRLTDKRRDDLIAGLAPLARFLMRQDETHGIVSNHLATTALGMVRWSKITGDRQALDRAELWIDRIRRHASAEGWMSEYGDADPGYQSWCTSSLAQIDAEMPELGVDDLVERSFAFLEAFAAPDGSFANGCGARMTRFFMPGGAEIWADRFPAAARLACFSRTHAHENRHLALDAIDEPNLVPFFNDTVLAAISASPLKSNELPQNGHRDFPQAGLFVRSAPVGLLTVNTRRGGWLSISEGPNDRRLTVTAEPAARCARGEVLRPVRGQCVTLTDDKIVVEAELEPVERMLPSPLKFLILRVLSLTAFKSIALGNAVKRMLAKLLLQEKGKVVGRVRRTINLQTGECESVVLSGTAQLIANPTGFSPRHMASQGYWQVGDDTPAET